jgi:hypothetical protein
MTRDETIVARGGSHRARRFVVTAIYVGGATLLMSETFALPEDLLAWGVPEWRHWIAVTAALAVPLAPADVVVVRGSRARKCALEIAIAVAILATSVLVGALTPY